MVKSFNQNKPTRDMTLREAFAKEAMNGFITAGEYTNLTPAGIAKQSVEHADALIAALEEAAS